MNDDTRLDCLDMEDGKPEPTDEDCVMWSMIGTKIYKKCAQVYKLETEIDRLTAKNTDTCKWHLEKKDGYNLEEHDYWETSCDNLFQFSMDQKAVDYFKFCPYCGRPIEEVKE